MKNPLSLLPLLLMVSSILGSIFTGIYITNSKKGTLTGMLLITGMPIFSTLIIFHWFQIHWVGEEGDYLVIWLVLLFYGFNAFQPLRIKNQIVAKSLFLVTVIPMIFLVPFLCFLTICYLRWLIPYFLGY